MGVMGGPPREVRRKDESVKHISNQVVEPFVARDITVTSLVSHTPPTSENDALADPVDTPAAPLSNRTNVPGNTIVANETSSKRFDLPSKLVKDYSGDNVASNVQARCEEAFFKQVLRHNGMDLSNGNFRRGERSSLSGLVFR
jgi:hypothetical protein